MEKHFAALKLLDPESDYKLTRAVSFSELPYARKICVEQTYHSGNFPGLIRQYSCEQIVDKSANTSSRLKIWEVLQTDRNKCDNGWRDTASSFNCFKTPDHQAPKSSIMQAPKFVPQEVEYMEIDDSNNIADDDTNTVEQPILPLSSASKCSNTGDKEARFPRPVPCKTFDNVTNKEQENPTKEVTRSYKDIKKVLRPLVPKAEKPVETKKMRHSSCCCISFTLLPAILVAIAILMPQGYMDNFCNRQSDFFNASVTLQEKVQGQFEAIKSLTNFLQYDNGYLSFACLIGGTGVGKSYSIEIIGTNVPWQNNIFVYLSPPKDGVNTKVLSSQNSNLIVFENLKLNDLNDLANALKKLQNLEKYCITVLAVFNTEHVHADLTRDIDLAHSEKTIAAFFEEKSIRAAIIPYRSLDDNALQWCVSEAAKNSGLQLTPEQLSRITESLLLSNSGCKGAYAKVQVIGREREIR